MKNYLFIAIIKVTSANALYRPMNSRAPLPSLKKNIPNGGKNLDGAAEGVKDKDSKSKNENGIFLLNRPFGKY